MTNPESQAGPCVAYFISPHGYGHAARASAVMQAIARFEPAARFEIFTKVPRWFFEDSLGDRFPSPSSPRDTIGYHALLTDIGLAQSTPFAEDLPETLRRLEAFLPFDAAQVTDIAGLVNRLGCQVAVCDISPLGIAVARRAGIPSVLVENFTWDWIYEGYLEDTPAFSRPIAILREMFAAADYHVQTEPVCHHGPADLTTSPVSREARTPRQQVRRELGIPSQANMVLVSMGGIPWHHGFSIPQSAQDGVTFVVSGGSQPAPAAPHCPDPPTGGLTHRGPKKARRLQGAFPRPRTGAPGRGGSGSRSPDWPCIPRARREGPKGKGRGPGEVQRQGNFVLLPHHSTFFHPDLVGAADAVIGKAGYSTLAEVYQAGLPFGYVPRPGFRESAVLTGFIERHMRGQAIPEEALDDGRWLSAAERLLSLGRMARPQERGAEQVARFICGLVS